MDNSDIDRITAILESFSDSKENITRAVDC